MRFIFTLFGLMLLVSYQGMSQPSEIYATAHTLRQSRPIPGGSVSLKEGLKQVEKIFEVSIAYKDEWVEGKSGAASASVFTTVEQALDVLLKDTGLFYKKAGDHFYVIDEVKVERDTHGSQSASASLMPLTASSRMMGTLKLSGSFNSPLSVTEMRADVTITGHITDENNQDFPGVNVILKGTTSGTNTDADGKYTISVPDANAILVFSFVGYATQEVAVGNRTVVDVVMAPDIRSLDEVVVTALGIEKSVKSLGYATTKVNSEELTVNRTPNVMNALQGKIAGVNISALGTGPGGTSKIRIRGQSSITGQNNPLIVVNGVPIDNTNFGTNPVGSGSNSDGSIGVRGGGGGGGNTSDGGDGLQSINPDDVESMTILKGAAASALYGSRAKDGVIMITTKSRGEGKGIGVTYNMNYTNETPLDFTDYQYEYGQGEGGIRPTSQNPTSGQWSFGEKFQPGMTHSLFDVDNVPYEPQRDIIRKFFRNGQNQTHTVTLASGGDKGGFSLSIASMENKGIVPNNSFSRKTANLGFSHELSEKLSFRGNINYSNEYNKNPPNIANQDNSIPTALYALANSMPLDLLDEKKFNAAGNEYSWSKFTNRTNPYFTLARQFQNIRRDRIFGNVSIKYNILPWLFVQGRVGQDFWSRDQDYNNFPNGVASQGASPNQDGFITGRYTQESRRFREINTDFLLSANKEFGDVGLNVNFGGNQMTRRSDLNSVQVNQFFVRDIYTIQNGRTKDPIYDLTERAVNSLYGSAEISYKQFLFLTGTLRNDWFSTLSPENRSILYPSISAGYVFSESFNAPQWLSFGKLRVAYAQVGSDSDVQPYSDVLIYGINSNLFSNQPVVTVGGGSPNTIPNPNLVPMTVTETEVGLDLKLFNNRLAIDLAAYRKITEDQIVSAQISDAAGFIDRRINSGRSRNMGLEALINVVPVETSDFVWEFTANGAYNITKVLSLLTDTPGEKITVATHVFDGELRQVVGEEMGQLAGLDYQRINGQRVFNPSTGLPVPTAAPVIYGSALPKWVGGFNNAFSYKGIQFSFLIDFKLGGKMLSGTNFNAIRHGLHKSTLVGREEGFVIGEGVSPTGEVNTAQAAVQTYYEFVRSVKILDPVIYDAGYWKLRQITLGYDFTKFLPDDFPIKSLKLSAVANNVLMLKKWVPNIDPESFGYSSDNLLGLESPGLPTTRSIGFNLNVKF